MKPKDQAEKTLEQAQMKEINNTIPMKTSPIQKGRLCLNNPQEALK